MNFGEEKFYNSILNKLEDMASRSQLSAVRDYTGYCDVIMQDFLDREEGLSHENARKLYVAMNNVSDGIAGNKDESVRNLTDVSYTVWKEICAQNGVRHAQLN